MNLRQSGTDSRYNTLELVPFELLKTTSSDYGVLIKGILFGFEKQKNMLTGNSALVKRNNTSGLELQHLILYGCGD